MSKHVVLLFALSVLVQSVSWAYSHPVCGARSNQLELNACADTELAKADKTLNDVYGLVVAQMADDPLFVKNLRSAQRAWLAFRDAELKARFSCLEKSV